MKKISLTLGLLATLATPTLATAQAAPPNAAEMAKISYLLGTWDCSWSAGPAKGVLVSTFSNVMDGAWIQETEAVEKDGAQVVTTMHYTGFDTAGKRWLHAGPNADGTYEVAQSSDTLIWHDVMPNDGGTATLKRITGTEYVLSEPFMQDGKALTYRNDCKKRS